MEVESIGRQKDRQLLDGGRVPTLSSMPRDSHALEGVSLARAQEVFCIYFNYAFVK